MKCPHCENQSLLMSERQGVEIDYCPQCRGVWLDRGELDKLIEKSAAVQASVSAPVAPAPQMAQPPQQAWGHPPHYPYKKHKSWLSDIFD